MASEVTLATKPHGAIVATTRTVGTKTWLGQTEISRYYAVYVYIYIYTCVCMIFYILCVYIYIVIIRCVGISSHIITKYLYHAVDIHIFKHVHR